MPINRELKLHAILVADDLAPLALSENDRQGSIYYLQKMAATFNMDISLNKTKIMAFQGKDPIQSKICLQSNILEGSNQFKYLG